MFNDLTTKLALRKIGLPSNTLSNPFANAQNPFANASNPFANASNPFANATNPFTKENAAAVPKTLQAWTGSNNVTDPATGELLQLVIAPAPRVGGPAPSERELKFPRADGKGCLVIFLRYCGDPFAHQTLLHARTLHSRHPGMAIVLVSHCTLSATTAWLSSLGGSWGIQVIIDESKNLYAAWGLGQSTTWYVYNPVTQMEVRKLGTNEGIWGTAVAEGGDRWLMGGYWAVDGNGRILCGGRSEKCEEKMDLAGAANVLGFRG